MAAPSCKCCVGFSSSGSLTDTESDSFAVARVSPATRTRCCCCSSESPAYRCSASFALYGDCPSHVPGPQRARYSASARRRGANAMVDAPADVMQRGAWQLAPKMLVEDELHGSILCQGRLLGALHRAN